MSEVDFLNGNTELLQWLLVAVVAFAASILGGLAGYGTGLVLPVVLAPVVGVANIVPVMALAMIFNNSSRVLAFWRHIRWEHVRRMLLLGLPACVAGGYGYTLTDTSRPALRSATPVPVDQAGVLRLVARRRRATGLDFARCTHQVGRRGHIRRNQRMEERRLGAKCCLAPPTATDDRNCIRS